ncbi:hypothetical protein [Poriferisphaera sp. WC338]|uniref:hypothetical protein n=1 Tax=Poriferisphaera sp. WC338 TaxID=3425129 RepID=UPI003D8147B4
MTLFLLKRAMLASMIIYLASITQIAWAERPAVPDFGVMHNSDGEVVYPYADLTQTTQHINNLLETLEDSPVQTFTWAIGSTSELLHYPTKVASNWGWRSTPSDDTPVWHDRVQHGRLYATQGYDPVRVVANKVKSMGRNFVPSYRMNDDHHVSDPYNFPATGEFWFNNQDKVIGSSPVAGYDYSNLLDFKHKAVRDFRMAVINESIDRYADVMDGYELDFNRVQIYFAPGEAQANAHLITEMVAQVRQKLDDVATQTGRQQTLFVRVPPALHNNEWAGLEVEKWIADRLVDVVMPSQLQTLSHDMPIDDFVAIAESSNSGVKVVPSLYPRTNFGYSFRERPDETTYKSPHLPNSRVADANLLRGAVSNYRFLGADGFEVYNFGLPIVEAGYEGIDAMASDHPTLGKDRVFAITPGFFTDNEDTFQYAKQLPETVGVFSSKNFELLVGDDINQMIRERPSDVLLRFGLTGVDSDLPLRIVLNGHQLHAGSIRDTFFTTDLVGTNDGPDSYFYITVGDLRNLVQGTNTITVTNPSLQGEVRFTDIQLGVFGASIPTVDGPVQTIKQPQTNSLKQVYFDTSGTAMTFTVSNRKPNGFEMGGGGIYIRGDAVTPSGSYDSAAGFLFDQAAYYPTVEGALESIDYSFWLGKPSASRSTSSVGILLMQDGKYFTTTNPAILQDFIVDETSVAVANLTMLDFFEERNDGDGLVLIRDSHPDFSAQGAPIYVGFLLSQTGDPTVGGPRTEIDDAIFTFNRVVIPEPTTLSMCIALLAVGRGGLRTPRAKLFGVSEIVESI